MSGSGLWFSRFAAGGEGWLPLVAFGSQAWMFAAAATAPDAADATMATAAGVGSADTSDGEWSGLDAPTRSRPTPFAR